MRYNTLINNTKCIEWGLNANQGALFDLLNQLSSWAKHTIIDNNVYYHISRNKILEELPLFYTKSDTVYRHFKILHEKGLIVYSKQGVKDIIFLTEKGKTWNEIRNSEMNPKKLGNESESNSEMNPTYNKTIKHNNTNNKTTKEKFVESIEEQYLKEPLLKWLNYRNKLKLESQFKFQYKKLKSFSNPMEVVENSIGNGYQGLFSPKTNNYSRNYQDGGIPL